MKQLKRLSRNIEAENFAKGESAYKRIAYLGFAIVDGKDVLCFDNSEDEYGTMYIDLKDLKNIIERRERERNEHNPKLIGYLTVNMKEKDLFTVYAGCPVYELHNKYFIEQGSMRYPFDKKILKPVIKFV